MERIDTNGPDEFIRVLLAALEQGYASDVVFRGERDRFPTILPTALRPSVDHSSDLTLAYFADSYINTHGGTIQTPTGAIMRVGDAWNDRLTDASPNMPSAYLHALAQHHGLATKLLDVSRNPLIAAYFAVDYRHGEQAGEYVRVLVVGSRERCVTKCEVVTVPPSANPRLHRQSGAFLRSDDWENGRQVSLADLEPELCREVTLKKLWINELRLMLHRVGVSAATVYGDLDAVAAEARWRATSEHMMLAEPPEDDDERRRC